MFFPNYGFSLGLQPHPTLSRGVVVLWFRLPTQSFRFTVLVFSNDFDTFYDTVRPRDKWLQATRTLTMLVFECGPKNLRCTNYGFSLGGCNPTQP